MAEEGEYSNHYDTLRPMGKGAFGFVRMAQRRDDGTAVRASVHEYRPILTLYSRKSLIRTSVIRTSVIRIFTYLNPQNNDIHRYFAMRGKVLYFVYKLYCFTDSTIQLSENPLVLACLDK